MKQVADLKNLSQDELKNLWRTLYGTQPPAYNRAHLVKRLAYRIQELVYGGLSDNAKAKMVTIFESSGLDENAGESRKARKRSTGRHDGPVAGTRIVREWNGRDYEVICVHGGYQYNGQIFRSLTAITKAITGTHWNGRAFFGLKSTAGKRRKTEANAVEA